MIWRIMNIAYMISPSKISLFFMKIIIKQKPNPIIVLLFIITIFPISKQAPAFIKYFPAFWQFQDMQWCLYVVADKCILWKAIVVCKVVILVFLLCSRVACKILYGSLGGAVVRALASHQCGLGSTPGVDAIHCMWVEFVVGSLPLLQEDFLQVLRFSPLLKNQHFQIPIWSGTHWHV